MARYTIIAAIDEEGGIGQGANHAGNPGSNLAVYYGKPGQPN